MQLTSPKKWIADRMVDLVVTAIVLALLMLAYNHYRSLVNAAGQNEERGQVLGRASDNIKDGQIADETRSKIDNSIGEASGEFHRDYQGAIDHEPETADRAHRPVPDSVREAFRKRRLARERSGCAGGQCEPGPSAEVPSERQGVLR